MRVILEVEYDPEEITEQGIVILVRGCRTRGCVNFVKSARILKNVIERERYANARLATIDPPF